MGRPRESQLRRFLGGLIRRFSSEAVELDARVKREWREPLDAARADPGATQKAATGERGGARKAPPRQG